MGLHGVGPASAVVACSRCIFHLHLHECLQHTCQHCTPTLEQPWSSKHSGFRLTSCCCTAVNATARSLHWPNANGPQLTSFRTVTFQVSLEAVASSCEHLAGLQYFRVDLCAHAVTSFARPSAMTLVAQRVINPAHAESTPLTLL